MAVVGRAILSGDAKQQQLGMPLLVELCMALKPEGSASHSSGLPVILTAQQGGVQLAAYINSIVSSWPELPQPASSSLESFKGSAKSDHTSHSLEQRSDQGSTNSVAAAWVAVLCLPHANSNPRQMIKLLTGLITATRAVLSRGAMQGSSLSDSSSQAEVLFLQCYARGVLASVLESNAAEELTQHLTDTLQLLSQHPLEFQVVRCAAEVASVITKGGKKLPLQQLQVELLHSNAALHDS